MGVFSLLYTYLNDSFDRCVLQEACFGRVAIGKNEVAEQEWRALDKKTARRIRMKKDFLIIMETFVICEMITIQWMYTMHLERARAARACRKIGARKVPTIQ